MKHLILVATVFIACFVNAAAARAEDRELQVFRNNEQKKFLEEAADEKWTAMLDHCSDILLKIPDDPFALGWAGYALAEIGYAETGGSLMRLGAPVIDAKEFAAYLREPPGARTTTIRITSSGSMLRKPEMEIVAAVLRSWAGELLRAPEPLPKEMDPAALKKAASFLGDLKINRKSLAPDVQLSQEYSTVELRVVGHSDRRKFPILKLFGKEDSFRPYVATKEWTVKGPADTKIDLVRVVSVSFATSEADENIFLDNEKLNLVGGRSATQRIDVGTHSVVRKVGTSTWRVKVEVPDDSSLVSLPPWPQLVLDDLTPNDKVTLRPLSADTSADVQTSALNRSVVPVPPGSYEILTERSGMVLMSNIRIDEKKKEFRFSLLKDNQRANVDFSVATGFSVLCRSMHGIAENSIASANPAQILTVSMPNWNGPIDAKYHGCRLNGENGSIKLPYLGWNDNTIKIRFGEQEVSISSPMTSGIKTLDPGSYDWMSGEIRISRIPENATIETASEQLKCTQEGVVGTCRVSPGTSIITIGAPGRVAETQTVSVSPGKSSTIEVHLRKSEVLSFGMLDAISLSTAGLGAAAGIASLAVAGAYNEDLASSAGVLSPEKFREARAVGLGTTIGLIVGGAMFAGGAGLEGWLVWQDLAEGEKLPEWQ